MAVARKEWQPILTRMPGLLARRWILWWASTRYHLTQPWITYRRRLAIGDLFLGPCQALIAALSSKHQSGTWETHKW
jgi:hypothetical protein